MLSSEAGCGVRPRGEVVAGGRQPRYAGAEVIQTRTPDSQSQESALDLEKSHWGLLEITGVLAQAAVTKRHELGDRIASGFWKLGIRDKVLTGLAFVLASGGCWNSLVPWLVVEAAPWSLPSSSHGILPVCVSLSKFPLLIRSPVMLD